MKNKLSMALTLAVIFAMMITSLALADLVTSDVILATAGDQTLINLGTVAPGEVKNVSTSFQLVCASKNHADKDNIVYVQYFNGTTAKVTMGQGREEAFSNAGQVF